MKIRTMKKSLTIIILLSLLLPCGLMAGEDTAWADEASLSRSSETFAYDVLNVVGSDDIEEQASSDDSIRKVGQPTPGIMLSLLMAGGLVRLMLRLRRRIKKNLDLLFDSVLSFLLLEESKYALSLYTPFKEICWLKWQRVELRL